MKQKPKPLSTGEQIKAARVAAGHTQQSLADAVGVTVVHLSRLENDHHSPGVDLLNKIMGVCKVAGGAV